MCAEQRAKLARYWSVKNKYVGRPSNSRIVNGQCLFIPWTTPNFLMSAVWHNTGYNALAKYIPPCHTLRLIFPLNYLQLNSLFTMTGIPAPTTETLPPTTLLGAFIGGTSDRSSLHSGCERNSDGSPCAGGWHFGTGYDWLYDCCEGRRGVGKTTSSPSPSPPLSSSPGLRAGHFVISRGQTLRFDTCPANFTFDAP